MEEDKRLSYFFLGLGVGVAVGILFAPKSGEQTRDYIKTKAGEGTGYIKRRGEELRETAGEYAERGKGVLARQKETLASAVEAGKAAYREAVAERRGAAQPDLANEGV
ncbi:MAG: YtxH domain-containing protein [Acidobacteria bacterium]|nr:YtxH domain-containing protein [Acidobacteriota bacterium]